MLENATNILKPTVYFLLTLFFGGDEVAPASLACGAPLGSDDGTGADTEFEKNSSFYSYFLVNSENFLNFAKSSNKFGEFLNFSRIF